MAQRREPDDYSGGCLVKAVPCALVVSTMAPLAPRGQHLREFFNTFDPEGTGTLSGYVLSKVLRRLKPDVFAGGELEKLFAAAGLSNESQLTKEDFLRLLAGVTAALLSQQDSQTSQAILEVYAENPAFQRLADRLTKEIMQRDRDDGEKLAKGIQMAVDKGVLPARVEVEPVTKVSVQGRTATDVAQQIIAKLGDAPRKGCVMTLQGLSGTGKGTTVAKLQELLPNVQTWSNGNIFRSLTLLAVTYAEQNNCSLQDCLTPGKLNEFCGMLEFNKFGKGIFDVKIEGLGLKHFVSDVEKTVLKDSKVGTKIPLVAEVTQGEVVKFVSGALEKMAAAGINVLVEGREQTLNHIRTPHRFELVLDDNSLIGKRQAALQAGGKAWDIIGKSVAADTDTVKAAIHQALITLAGMDVTATVLSQQNSQTSQAILEAYAENPAFQSLADRLTKEIMQRDVADGEKLAKGIQMAVDKGVLPARIEVEPVMNVSVQGRTATQVSEQIIAKLGDAPSKGCVMTLQGLSGTGKGTTVAKLQELLPNAQTWSNGNIFRSLTLLAVTYAEQNNCSLQDCLTPGKLKDFCGMLEFNKFDKGIFDVKIEGLGLKYFVSDVEKTVLKDSKVGTKIPLVAEVTQGEVVKFVSGALDKMAAAGINVLVEGREQTLNHIRTPHRFALVLDDNSLIGKRQAALQAGGKAWDIIGKSTAADTNAVKAAMEQALAALTAIEFTYFKTAKARGEPTRIALHASGISYKDTSISVDEFKAGKEAGKYGGGLPLMKLPSGKHFGQSLAMVRYVGKLGKSGLYPTDPELAYLVDSVMDTAQDALTKAPQDPDTETKLAKRKEYAAGKLKHYMDEIDKAVCANGGPFVGGKQLTVADLVAHYYLVDSIQSGNFDGVAKEYLNNWPKLVAHSQAVKSSEIIKAYEAYVATRGW